MGPQALLRSVAVVAAILPLWITWRAWSIATALPDGGERLWLAGRVGDEIGWDGAVFTRAGGAPIPAGEAISIGEEHIIVEAPPPRLEAILRRDAAAFRGWTRIDFGADPLGTKGPKDRIVVPPGPEGRAWFHLEPLGASFDDDPDGAVLVAERAGLRIDAGAQIAPGSRTAVGSTFTVQSAEADLAIRWVKRVVAEPMMRHGRIDGYADVARTRFEVDRVQPDPMAVARVCVRGEGRERCVPLPRGERVRIEPRPRPTSIAALPDTRADLRAEAVITRWIDEGHVAEDGGHLVLKPVLPEGRADHGAARRVQRWIAENERRARPVVQAPADHGVEARIDGGPWSPARWDRTRAAWMPAFAHTPQSTAEFRGRGTADEVRGQWRIEASPDGRWSMLVPPQRSPATTNDLALVVRGGPEGTAVLEAWAGARVVRGWTTQVPDGTTGGAAVRVDAWRATVPPGLCAFDGLDPCLLSVELVADRDGVAAVDLDLPVVVEGAWYAGVPLEIDLDAGPRRRLSLPVGPQSAVLALRLRNRPARVEEDGGPWRLDEKGAPIALRQGATERRMRPAAVVGPAGAQSGLLTPWIAEDGPGATPLLVLQGRPLWLREEPAKEQEESPAAESGDAAADGGAGVGSPSVAAASAARPCVLVAGHRVADEIRLESQAHREHCGSPGSGGLRLDATGAELFASGDRPWVHVASDGRRITVTPGESRRLVAGDRFGVQGLGPRWLVGTSHLPVDRDLDPTKREGATISTLGTDPRLRAAAAAALATLPTDGPDPEPLRGVVLALDAASGEVLACAARGRVDHGAPDAAEACWGPPRFRPGSTWKIAAASAALRSDDPLVRRMLDGDPPGGYGAGGPRATLRGATLPTLPLGAGPDLRLRSRLSNHEGHSSAANLDLVGAMATSSNTYFAYLSLLLDQPLRQGWGAAAIADPEQRARARPIEALADHLHFDEERTLGLMGASWTGRYPRVAADDDAALAARGVGQDEVRLTPLGLALLLTTTTGAVPRPHLGDRRDDAPTAGPLLDDHGRTRLVDALSAVVTKGTARGAFVGWAQRPGVHLWGKTGSAQRIDADGEARTDSWFGGVVDGVGAPVVIVVLVPGGGLGGKVAAPLAAQVAEEVITRDEDVVLAEERASARRR